MGLDERGDAVLIWLRNRYAHGRLYIDYSSAVSPSWPPNEAPQGLDYPT